MAMQIHPYHNGLGWVFDDEDQGLFAEGLVEGIDTILDLYTKEHNIDASKGLDVIFDDKKIDSYDIMLEKTEEIQNDGRQYGNMYYCDRYGIEGWLCPSLYLYFNDAPKRIYIKTNY